MTITLELPQELEQELSVEAEKINLSLSEYILRLLSVRQVLNNPPKTGAELVNYWQKEGLIIETQVLQYKDYDNLQVFKVIVYNNNNRILLERKELLNIPE